MSNKGVIWGKDEQVTPWDIYYYALNRFDFPLGYSCAEVLDCAASKVNTKSDNFLSKEDDGLAVDWESEYCWVNPPYSQRLAFVQKAVEQMNKGKKIIMLLDADNLGEWFRVLLANACEVMSVTDNDQQVYLLAYLEQGKGFQYMANVDIRQVKRVGKIVWEYVNVASR